MSLILIFLSYKYRGLVHLILPLEVLYNLLNKMTPSFKNDYTMNFVAVSHITMFLLYYTNKGWQIFVLAASYLTIQLLVIDYEM